MNDFTDFSNYNPENPEAWGALWVEKSTPIDEEAKKAQILNLKSFSRRYLFPFIKVYAFCMKIIVSLLKIIIPVQFKSHSFLHSFISFGLHHFVSPQANLLILRHFHLGSNVLKFLSQNLHCENFPSEPLYPKSVWDLRPNMILQHDVNLFNFVAYFNQKGFFPEKGSPLKFQAIQPVELKMEDFPNRWSNILDIESAIELMTPFFQLFTTEHEFWRASISLQLDETIAGYYCQLVGNYDRMSSVINRHPLLPNSTLEASRRLVIHGLSTEVFYQKLVELKEEQETTKYAKNVQKSWEMDQIPLL